MIETVRIVYMGTPDFAVAPLERLYAEGYDIIGVFTQPDKPKNRGMKMTFSPVKDVAIKHGTPVFQPDSVRDGDALEFIRELQPDLISVVAYGKILPKEILEYPVYGCINIHGSILPKYRGSAPIQHAVLAGERETGVTSMYMAEDMDAGDVIFVKKTEIGEDESSGELYMRLSALGAELLAETITAISEDRAPRVKQDHDKATFAPPLTRDMSPIDWNKSAIEIKCQVRGLNPWPVATAVFDGIKYKIYSVTISENRSGKKPGEVITSGKEGLSVVCGDGVVTINELQAPGKKRMSAIDYLRGHPICR